MSEFSLLGLIESFLKSLARQAVILNGFRCLSWLLSCILLSWLLAFAGDRAFDTSSDLRLLILLLGVGGSLAAIGRFLFFCRARINSPFWLARQLRKVHRRLGEKLLGIVELSNRWQTREGAVESSGLFDAAQRKLADEIAELDASDIFSARRDLKSHLLLLVLLCITVSAFLAFPQLIPNSIERWINPWSDAKRKTLTQLGIAGNALITPSNEEFVLRIPLAAESMMSPSTAKIRSPDQPNFEQEVQANGKIFEFLIPPLSRPTTFEVASGDFSTEISFLPKDRPRIIDFNPTISWPDYLAFPPSEREIGEGTLKILRGSTVELKGRANKILSMVGLIGGEKPEVKTLSSPFFSFKLPEPIEDHSLEIRFQDIDQLTPTQAFAFEVQLYEDEGPSCKFDSSVDYSPMLQFETREFKMEFHDDLGLKAWAIELTAYRKGQKILDETLVEENLDGAEIKELSSSLPFKPSFFALEDGDVVELALRANDRFPNRIPTKSEKLTFRIIGSGKHAQMITSQLEALIASVSEVARDQETLQSQTIDRREDLKKSDARFVSAHQRTTLKQLSEKQKGSSSKLSLHARNGLELLERAMLNPVFEASKLQNFGSAFDAIEGIAETELLKSEESMVAAVDSHRKVAISNLSKSVAHQAEALAKLKDLLDDFERQMDQLEAKTLAQRLGKLGNEEEKISQQLKSRLPNIIGQPESLLVESDRSFLDDLKNTQSSLGLEAEEIKNEISRYYERTGIPEYQKVSLLMEQERTSQSLDHLADQIRRNVGLRALDKLSIWQKNFLNWSEILERQLADSAQTGGQGSSSGKDLSQQILSLLKIRNEQGQVLKKTHFHNLHSLVNRTKPWLSALQESQRKLAVDLTDTQISLANESLNPLFDEAHTSMSNACDFLTQGITGQETQGEQQNAKEIVSDLINLLVEGQQNGTQREAKDELSMTDFLLMKSRAGQGTQGEGKSPNPGSIGGGFDQEGEGSVSSSDDKVSVSSRPLLPQRKADAGVRGTPTVPSEFRRAMERYFEAMEK